MWLAWMAGGQISVASSKDGGKSFSTPVAGDQGAAQPRLGTRCAAQDRRRSRRAASPSPFRSSGTRPSTARCFTRARPTAAELCRAATDHANNESQRFEALALDADGSVFAAWLDKRNRVPAQQRGQKYDGAGLFFASSKDGGATYSEARMATDNTCECCRLGLAFAGPGRPVVVFRNIFEGGVRDHAIVTFADLGDAGRSPSRQPGRLADRGVPASRAEPLDLASGNLSRGLVHQRQGVARACSMRARTTADRTFSEPIADRPAGPQPVAPLRARRSAGTAMVWKEFDGEKTTVNLMTSHDDGKTWSKPKADRQRRRTRPIILYWSATAGRPIFPG